MPLFRRKGFPGLQNSSFKSPLNNTSDIFKHIQNDYEGPIQLDSQENQKAPSKPKNKKIQIIDKSEEPCLTSDSRILKSPNTYTQNSDSSYIDFLQEPYRDHHRQSTPLIQPDDSSVSTINSTLLENADITILSRSKKIQAPKCSANKLPKSPQSNRKLTDNFKQFNTTDHHANKNTSVLSDLLSQENFRDTDLTPEVINHPEVKSLYINFVNEWEQNQNSSKKKIRKSITLSSLESVVQIRRKVIKKQKRVSSATQNQTYSDDKKDLNVRKIVTASSTDLDVKVKSNVVKKHKRITYATGKQSSKNLKNVLNKERSSSTKSDANVASEKENVPKNREKFIKQTFQTSLAQNTSKTKKKSSKAPKVTSEKNESHLMERMEVLMSSRNVGLYVSCDNCDKLRYLPFCKDPLDLPKKWYCPLNPDSNYNKCTDPNFTLPEEVVDTLIDNEYNAGSIVWAKMDGFPWWPAMVEDDPDTEVYYWLDDDSNTPSWYHVTFFDSAEVTRVWRRTNDLKPYKINADNPKYTCQKYSQFNSRINIAMKQAEEACNLNLLERLKKFSFIYRYKPKKRDSKAPKRKQSTLTCKANKEKRIKKLENETMKYGKSANDVDYNANEIEPYLSHTERTTKKKTVTNCTKAPNELTKISSTNCDKPKKNFSSRPNHLSMTLSELSDLLDEVDIANSFSSDQLQIDPRDIEEMLDNHS